MGHQLAQHQDAAEALARKFWTDARGGLPSQGGLFGPPPDAGSIYNLREIVGAAWNDGRRSTEPELQELQDAARGVLSAYQRLLDKDDLDGLRDALTVLQEALGDG